MKYWKWDDLFYIQTAWQMLFLKEKKYLTACVCHFKDEEDVGWFPDN